MNNIYTVKVSLSITSATQSNALCLLEAAIADVNREMAKLGKSARVELDSVDKIEPWNAKAKR